MAPDILSVTDEPGDRILPQDERFLWMDRSSSRCSSRCSHDGQLQCASSDWADDEFHDDDDEEGGQAGVVVRTSPAPFAGNVHVEHSTNVHIGDSTHYHAPVMLVVSDKDKQQVLPSRQLVLSAASLAEGAVLQAGGEPNPGPSVEPQREVQSGPTWKRFLGWPYALVPVLLLAVLAAVGLVFTVKSDVEEQPNGVLLVRRSSWGAKKPARPLQTLVTPVATVVMHHTGTNGCFYTEECKERMSEMQNLQLYGERQLDDIGYNYLVGGDGVVYEGRGWDKVGQHTQTGDWDAISIGVALIGNFIVFPPTTEQREMLIRLLDLGVHVGKVQANYRLVGVCQIKSTQSPGLRLMHELRTWSHWSNHTEPNAACSA